MDLRYTHLTPAPAPALATFSHQQLVCDCRGGGMNLTEFEDIVNLSERLLEQAKNIIPVDEFGFWTEGVLLV